MICTSPQTSETDVYESANKFTRKNHLKVLFYVKVIFAYTYKHTYMSMREQLTADFDYFWHLKLRFLIINRRFRRENS